MDIAQENREPKSHTPYKRQNGFRIVEPHQDTVEFDSIRYRRSQTASKCLLTSSIDLSKYFLNEFLSVLNEIETCGLRSMPLEPDEQLLVDTLLEKMSQDLYLPNQLNLYMIVMLYVEAFHLPEMPEPDHMPDWFSQTFWRYAISGSTSFRKIGDVEKYTRHIVTITNLLLRKLSHNPDSLFWRRAGFMYAENINLVPLYFGDNNLSELHVNRSAITKKVLKDMQYQLEHKILRAAANQKIVRLGVYVQSVGSSSEMFASIPFFGYLDRETFDVCVYTHSISDPFLEQRLRKLIGQITVLPDNIKDSVAIIREDDLDMILFCNNMTAVTNKAHIMAQHRLAHHQCVHFCQPLSTGISNVDCFFLGGDIIARTKSCETFSEKLIGLDGSGICFDLPSIHLSNQKYITRAMLSLSESQTVFISGANCFKIIPELRATWAKILAKVPCAVLILYPFGPAWASNYNKELFVAELVDVFQQHGLDREQLLVFDTLPERGSIIELLSVADIYLDSAPYSGATSLLDPLQVGLPLLTVYGNKLRFCQGATILNELGLGELSVDSASEYRQKAVELGLNPDLRIQVRHKIKEAMKRRPAFLDVEGFGKKTSKMFRDMFRNASSNVTRLPKTGTG